MNRFVSAFLFTLILLAFVASAAADSPDQVADLLARINRERTTRGLAPFALNPKLTAAAQGQANDMAARGKFSHAGSDGSTPAQRAARKGYPGYSWGVRIGENWAWYRDAAAAMNMWMHSAPHTENILHPLYREIGIGVAQARMGGFVFVADFGAQPNVLPVLVNDGAGTTTSSQVTLTLANEDADSGGDGPKVIGHAREVLVSNDPNFSGAQWQPYALHLPWTLSSGGGLKTVYVKFKDAQGRTSTSSDSITIAGSGVPAPPPTIAASSSPSKTVSPKPSATATKTATRKPSPTITNTATRKPSATITKTATFKPTATKTRPLPSLTATATATDTPDQIRGEPAVLVAAAIESTPASEPTESLVANSEPGPMPDLSTDGSAGASTEAADAGASGIEQVGLAALGASGLGLLFVFIGTVRYNSWRRQRQARWARTFALSAHSHRLPPERLRR